MKSFNQFTAEAKKYKTISRSEYKTLLDTGHTIKPAGLYEPDHAPKGTRFAHAELSPSIVRFVRITPPKGK